MERTPLLPKCAAFINVSEAEGDRIVPAKAQLSSLEVSWEDSPFCDFKPVSQLLDL